MILLKNQKLFFIILYALYNVCNLQIANCEGLTDVYNQNLSKIDKTLGWVFLIGTSFIIGYTIYKGIYPSDSTNINLQDILPLKLKEDTQAQDSKIQERNDITCLKNSDYLKFLQEVTKYY